jgi:hypothetical protein
MVVGAAELWGLSVAHGVAAGGGLFSESFGTLASAIAGFGAPVFEC